jgi:uncharacterized protein YbbK (DUF523 family)
MRDNQRQQPILVSACLLGLPTRYDGQAKRSQAVIDCLRRDRLLPIPVCPEQLAGLTTPREKTFFLTGDGHAVMNGTGRVISAQGRPMNEAFQRGARLTLQVARLCGCRRALLKERSPSCGVHRIYRGGELVPGAGVTSALLIEAGIEVLSEEDLR